MDPDNLVPQVGSSSGAASPISQCGTRWYSAATGSAAAGVASRPPPTHLDVVLRTAAVGSVVCRQVRQLQQGVAQPPADPSASAAAARSWSPRARLSSARSSSARSRSPPRRGLADLAATAS